jgi:hypothetical protein
MNLNNPEARWEAELIELATRRGRGFIRCTAGEQPTLKAAALKVRTQLGVQSIVFWGGTEDGLTVQYGDVAGSGPLL